ncbi:MAG TPA: hypothetical protein VF530_13180 [Planctomycetota bacterium]
MPAERDTFKIKFTRDGKIEIESPKLKAALQQLQGSSQESLCGELRITQPLVTVQEPNWCGDPIGPKPPLIICLCDEAFLLKLRLP